MGSDITFGPYKTDVSQKFEHLLSDVALVLKKYDDTRIDIDGYTDTSGDYAQNVQLSKSRAQSVAVSLISHGIKRSRIYHQGHGPANPIATNKTKAGRAANRRVEISISRL